MLATSYSTAEWSGMQTIDYSAVAVCGSLPQ